MLRNNLELIVQYPAPGGYRCRGFTNLRLFAPVYLVVDGAMRADQRVAHLLGEALCQEIHRYTGSVEQQSPPCGGTISRASCHAMDEPSCRKIFVRVSATAGRNAPSSWPDPTAESSWLAHPNDAQWQVIPAMPAGTDVPAHVPAQWRGINVAFWKRHPTEALWGIMQRAGLTPDESRLFISYVRRDSSAVADQLFVALTDEGFDVFLDRCSVPVGVEFQERLMQDLSDKAMVVLLNSPGVAQSYWIQEEIAAIKTYRLGLLELQFPNSTKRPDIDPDFTASISPSDLVPAGRHYGEGAQKFSVPALRRAVSEIKAVHGRAIHRRRFELIDNFAAALMAASVSSSILPDGSFLVHPRGRGNPTVVGLNVRPPELTDFSLLHQRGNVSPNRLGWLISPAPFFVARRKTDIAWLGGVCHIQHADEAQIAQLIAKF
jgi:hypothetical protein